MNNKIYVLTYHKSHSYGACLQAFATWKFFESIGMDMAFLDYENEYEARLRKRRWWVHEGIRGTAVWWIKKYFLKYDQNARSAFSHFHQMLPAENPNYISEKSILAVGSDQTWNPIIQNGIDRVFFLDGVKCQKKLSLASSAGGYVFDSNEIEIIKPWLDGFSAISVREEHLYKQLKAIVDSKINISIISDPTMWLDRFFWEQAVSKTGVKRKGHIFCYLFNDLKPAYASDLIHYYKEKLGEKTFKVALSSYKGKDCDELITGATPLEFLGYIRSASYVITNSFHGVVFSIIYNIPFTYVPVTCDNNGRIEELLMKLGLEDRMASERYYPVLSVDYSGANERLERIREKSVHWIMESIGFENECGTKSER